MSRQTPSTTAWSAPRRREADVLEHDVALHSSWIDVDRVIGTGWRRRQRQQTRSGLEHRLTFDETLADAIDSLQPHHQHRHHQQQLGDRARVVATARQLQRQHDEQRRQRREHAFDLTADRQSGGEPRPGSCTLMSHRGKLVYRLTARSPQAQVLTRREGLLQVAKHRRISVLQLAARHAHPTGRTVSGQPRQHEQADPTSQDDLRIGRPQLYREHR